MSSELDLPERGAASRERAEALAGTGQHDEALAEVQEALALVRALREAGHVDEALAAAAASVELATSLTRAQPRRYLLALACATDQLGRCCQRAQQFERAAAAFERAVDGFRILAAADPSAHRLGLLELMSCHGLALAQSGQLERAYEVAGELVEFARGQLPRALPLLTGGLAFRADLAADLQRPREGLAHLVEGVRVLDEAMSEGLPGAGAAAARMAASVRAAAVAADLELPEDVVELLSRQPSARVVD